MPRLPRSFALLPLLFLLGVVAATLCGRPARGKRQPADAASDAEKQVYEILWKDGMISHPGLPYLLFIRQVEGRRLVDPVLKHRDARGHIDFVAHAREGELHVDPAGKLLIRLCDGVSWTHEGSSRVHFRVKTWDAPLPENLGQE